MKHYIQLIGNTYHYRHRVPCDLKEHFESVGITELRVSLKTDSRDTATSAADQLTYTLNRLFDMLRLCPSEKTRVYIEATRNPLLNRMLRMGLRKLAKQTIAKPDLLDSSGNSPTNTEKNPRDDSEPQSKAMAVDPGEPLRKVVSLFINKKCAPGGGWGVKSQIDRSACLELFVEIMECLGIAGINQVTKQQLIKYDSIMRKMPPNRNKIARFRDASIARILDMFAKKEFEPIKYNTVRKHLNTVSSFLNWSLTADFVHVDFSKVLTTSRKSVERTKYPYDLTDIRRLIESPVYSDPLSNEFNRARTYAERFFVPLLLLFTGARTNEICQLYVDDIDINAEIPTIRITENAHRKQRLKCNSSRVIPIHPTLIAVGFLEYVKFAAANGAQRLFPMLKHSANGFAGKFTAWYGSYNRKYVALSDTRKTAHSFRHLMADTLKNLGVQKQMIAELLGHTTGSITMETYGQPYAIKNLYEMLRQVDFISAYVPNLKTMAAKIYSPGNYNF